MLVENLRGNCLFKVLHFSTCNCAGEAQSLQGAANEFITLRTDYCKMAMQCNSHQNSPARRLRCVVTNATIVVLSVAFYGDSGHHLHRNSSVMFRNICMKFLYFTES